MDRPAPLLPGTVLPVSQMSEFKSEYQVLTDANLLQAQILEDADKQAKKLVVEARETAKIECEQRAALLADVAERKLAEELHSIEGDVASLVASLVRSIIGDLDQNEAIKRATRTALEQLSDHKLARIKAAAEALVPVTEAASELAQPEIIEVVLDEELSGDRVVFSSDRTVAEIGLSSQVKTATASWSSEDG